MATEVFIGIDISKPRLDVFNLATGEMLEFANTPSGIQAFVKFAKKAKPTLLVCESTGGLEQPLLLGCSEAKLPLAVVNPRQVRDFSRAMGKQAKTDAIDAVMLSEFASRMRPEITSPAPEELRALEALVTRRTQILEMLTMERNRLGSTREENTVLDKAAPIWPVRSSESRSGDCILGIPGGGHEYPDARVGAGQPGTPSPGHATPECSRGGAGGVSDPALEFAGTGR